MSESVKSMFSRIAPKYDFMNNLLSFGLHHLWRTKAVRLSAAKPGDRVLDCATGTGDLAIAFYRKTTPEGKVVATDFCSPMVDLARIKFKTKNLNIDAQVEDAMNLSFADNSFDISSISFGIRNVDSPAVALSEMARVTRPGGHVLVLEFGQPRGFFNLLYKIYSKLFMPVMGLIFAADKDAYTYLPETAAKFPCREEFIDIIKSTGAYSECNYHVLSGGIAFIYIGIVS